MYIKRLIYFYYSQKKKKDLVSYSYFSPSINIIFPWKNDRILMTMIDRSDFHI